MQSESTYYIGRMIWKAIVSMLKKNLSSNERCKWVSNFQGDCELEKCLFIEIAFEYLLANVLQNNCDKKKDDDISCFLSIA